MSLVFRRGLNRDALLLCLFSTELTFSLNLYSRRIFWSSIAEIIGKLSSLFLAIAAGRTAPPARYPPLLTRLPSTDSFLFAVRSETSIPYLLLG